MCYKHLSYDVASGSEITLCIKINKPLLVVNRFWLQYEMTSITICTKSCLLP